VQSNILTPLFSLPGSETVHGAVDSWRALVQHMGVDHRRLDLVMPEEFLYGAEVITNFQKMCGKRMAERVTAGRLGQADVSCGLFDRSWSHRVVQMMSPVLARSRVQAHL
jgi:hypothetical protein